jgi:hypothetical protein
LLFQLSYGCICGRYDGAVRSAGKCLGAPPSLRPVIALMGRFAEPLTLR